MSEDGKRFYRPEIPIALKQPIKKLAKAEKSTISEFLGDLIVTYLSKVSPSDVPPQLEAT
jgi:hypothetical protein